MAKALEELGDKTGNERGLVRFALVHLSGSRRGQMQGFEADLLKVGTDPGNDFTFDPVKDPAVSPWHAEFSFENCDLILRDKGSRGGTFVNHQCITEIVLQDNDLIMLGKDGPNVRVRIKPDAYARCKPLRDILCDCRDIAKAAQRGWMTSSVLFLRHLLSDLTFHATIPIRLVAGAIVFFPIILFAILLYSHYSTRLAYEEQISKLISKLEIGSISQTNLEEKVEKERKQVTESLQALKQGVERLTLLEKEAMTQEDFSALRQRITRMETEIAAAERIISIYRGGIALIVGSYGFVDKSTGRILRYQGIDPNGRPLLDTDGRPLFTLEGETPPVTVSFTGTGFLVDKAGLMLTNRHLAKPWEMDRVTDELINEGFLPRFFKLRAFFPSVTLPVDLSVATVSDRADAALLKLNPGELLLPVLKLAPNERKMVPGEPILLLGYPTGFDALLARADPETSSAIITDAGGDFHHIAQELADRKLIRPLATQGHIGDILKDQFIYDAQTTFGGSGGPVFNLHGEVIAINYMILQRFGGANFGVPIRFGIDLLSGAGKVP